MANVGSNVQAYYYLAFTLKLADSSCLYLAMFVTWYLFLMQHTHFASCVCLAGFCCSAFPLLRILLVSLPHLYFLPTYWPISILLN